MSAANQVVPLHETPDGYEDRVYDVYAQFSVPASRTITQFVNIENVDAPWYLAGVTTPTTGGGNGGGGQMRIRLRDSQGRFLENDLCYPQSLIQLGSAVAPIYPAVYYPEGGQIKFDVQEYSGAGAITVQIVFWGWKRYLKGKAPC